MVASGRSRIALLVSTILLGSTPVAGLETRAPETPQPEAAAARDGQHDFDFEFGSWRTHLKRLRQPLSGSTQWVEYEGTTVVREVWEGRANLVELVAEGAAGKLELLSLRLYDPAKRQWSLHSASVAGGELAPPVIGGFRDGRGEFQSEETFDGRPIRVRFVISQVAPDTWRFEQAFSPDGGESWEVNWIAIDTRADGSAGATR